MTPTTGQKRSFLKLLGLYDEFTALKAKNDTTLTGEESSRIKYIDFLCLARSLPNELKDEVLEYYLPDLEPLDITDTANHRRPSWCTTDRAEFTHWRQRRLTFRTDDLTPANIDAKVSAAQAFIQTILFSSTHLANFPIMGASKKKIIFEIFLRVDLSEGGVPEMGDDNLEALWRLLHALNGRMGHLQVVFIWKDNTNQNDMSAAAKREIAPDNTGPFAVVKRNMLTILLTAMSHYSSCLLAPPTTLAVDKWQRYLSPAMALHSGMTDAQRWVLVQRWSSTQVNRQFGSMWTTRSKRGFLLWQLCNLFQVGWPRDDADIRIWVWWQGEPQFPLDLGLLA